MTAIDEEQLRLKELVKMDVAPKQRFSYIDAVRGISALLVMLQHSLYESGLLGDFRNHDVLTGIIPTWLELGETGVVAFFLVSGFVIPLSLEKAGDLRLFWLRRASRIYPLYLFIYLATVFLRAGDGLHTPSDFVSNFGAHLLFVQEYVNQIGFVGGAWTLSLEIIWYIGLSFLFFFRLDKDITLIVTASVVISVAAQICCGIGYHLPMGRLSMLLCCVIGLVCYRFQKRDISDSVFYKLLALLAAVIISNIVIGFQIFPSTHPTATFLQVVDSWSLAALIFFLAFTRRRMKIWDYAILKYLGSISYSIYLVHPVILYAMRFTSIVGLPLVVLTFSTTIVVSMLTYKYIEQPPIALSHALRFK